MPSGAVLGGGTAGDGPSLPGRVLSDLGARGGKGACRSSLDSASTSAATFDHEEEREADGRRQATAICADANETIGCGAASSRSVASCSTPSRPARELSRLHVPAEWSSAKSRPLRCRCSAETAFPIRPARYELLHSECKVVEEYDPRKPKYIRMITEEEEVEMEVRLLKRQMAQLKAMLAAREAAPDPPQQILEGYRRALREMGDRAAELALGPYAVPLEAGDSPPGTRGPSSQPSVGRPVAAHAGYLSRPPDTEPEGGPGDDGLPHAVADAEARGKVPALEGLGIANYYL